MEDTVFSDAEKILKDVRENKVKYLISDDITRVVKHINFRFNNDNDSVVHFWFDSAVYNLLDYGHILLLKKIFQVVGVTHELVLTFLDNIGDTHLLHRIGVLRLKTAKGKEYYKLEGGAHREGIHLG